jgi:lipopolysaccharide export system protein LptA
VPGSRSPGFTGLVWLACAVSAIAGAFALRELHGQNSPIAEAETTPADAVELTADWSQEWDAGEEYVGVFRGRCELRQGTRRYAADKMVVWSRDAERDGDRRQKLTVYLEGRVQLADGDSERSESTALAELQTHGVRLTVGGRQVDQPAKDDPVFQRAMKQRSSARRGVLVPTQFTVDGEPGPNWEPVPMAAPPAMRRVRIFQRSALPFDVESRKLDNRTPPEQVTIITGGVSVLIYGFALEGMGQLGTIDLSADRVTIWTDAFLEEGFSADFALTPDATYQVYLEGNIVIRQGEHVVRAERAFYDARDNRALVLNADLRTVFPMTGANVRVKAERMRQLSEGNFHAQNAFVTTSQYGRPGYRVQATDVFVEERPVSQLGRSEPPRVDPETGALIEPTYSWITALNTTGYVEDVPLFFLPKLSGGEEEINTPLQAITFQQDRIFGSQLYTQWNMFPLLGLERRPGMIWRGDINYLSERGPYLGTHGAYSGNDPWGHYFEGMFLSSYVYDQGRDNLGLDRRSLIPADNNRGRVLLRHDLFLSPETVFQGEIGYVSDRNYLEQYYEWEFDRGKDQETLGYLRHFHENWAWSALVRPQTNPFEYNTQWLPRGDMYALGEPVFNTPLRWFTHTWAGYGAQPGVQLPSDPNDLFTPLPYYTSVNGLVAASRHEINAPFDLGPLHVVPYGLGEAAYWGDSFDGSSVDRYYGQVGARASIFFWKPMPWVQSDFFNLNGLAHKMLFSADYMLAGSTTPLSQISQWNEFDDNSQERFRERLAFNTFGSTTGIIPPQYDPRFYAVRSLAGTSVTAPYNELVDSMNVLTLRWNQRLQTKRGLTGAPRLMDWM